jgi:hypothetical protein
MSATGQSRLRVAVPALDNHPSSYVVRDFVRSLVGAGVEPIRLGRWIGRLMSRSGLQVPRISRQIVIVPLMGPRFDVLAASSLYGTLIPFCWDVWEPQWALWARILDRLKPPLVITTAMQSAQHLGANLGSSVVKHLPEAVDLGKYRAGAPLLARSMDVLELGRRNPHWHEAVKMAAENHGVKHLYERAPGDLIFLDETTLVAGLADTKVSICFPSNLTHPERAGSVSTLTSRYLESIASRCLVLGTTPHELVDLLGFNPVVEADMVQPWQQLRSILCSIESYQAQVDEAYERVQSVGGWDFRIRQLLNLIRAV